MDHDLCRRAQGCVQFGVITNKAAANPCAQASVRCRQALRERAPLGVVIASVSAVPVAVWRGLAVAVVCIFPVATDSEHLLPGLFGDCVLFSEVCLYWVVCFSLSLV